MGWRVQVTDFDGHQFAPSEFDWLSSLAGNLPVLKAKLEVRPVGASDIIRERRSLPKEVATNGRVRNTDKGQIQIL
jgi:hypothetical protein